MVQTIFVYVISVKFEPGHNSTQCYAFFADLRRAIADDEVDEFMEMSKRHHFPEDLVQVDLTTKTIQNGGD
ncbi:unnamed protein product [Hydatigera taeniaeformis]|uniref:EthD domain-containing protein n=1 Tax=Hydatigena taeniaeformis TaxID=6205 RepID=A0A0R3WQH9_HYDTA|nr:unnamed protein product [Hydatigera taeniaeformis]